MSEKGTKEYLRYLLASQGPWGHMQKRLLPPWGFWPHISSPTSRCHCTIWVRSETFRKWRRASRVQSAKSQVTDQPRVSSGGFSWHLLSSRWWKQTSLTQGSPSLASETPARSPLHQREDCLCSESPSGLQEPQSCGAGQEGGHDPACHHGVWRACEFPSFYHLREASWKYICWHFHLGLPASRATGNRSCCLCCSIYGILL